MAVCAVTMSAANAQPPAPMPEQGPMPIEGRVISSGPAMPLFTCVKVEDPDHIHPCAVPKIVMVPDPCACHHPCSCCEPKCVAIKICVPPCGCVEHKCKHGGRKQEYDYGDYEVEITVKDGYVKVDYDD
jgi:hypothetical protein